MRERVWGASVYGVFNKTQSPRYRFLVEYFLHSLLTLLAMFPISVPRTSFLFTKSERCSVFINAIMIIALCVQMLIYTIMKLIDKI